MTLARRVEVLGGTGTVCREGALVAWFAPGFPAAVAEELLEAARASSAVDGASGLAGALEAAAASVPAAFSVLADVDGDVAIVAHGHVVVSEDGLERLRGAATTGLVSADLTPTGALTVRGESDPDQLNRPGSVPFDLRNGVVPGGGVTIWAPKPSPASPPPKLDEHVVLFDLSVPDTAPRPPLPIASAPVAPIASAPVLSAPEMPEMAVASGAVPSAAVSSEPAAPEAVALGAVAPEPATSSPDAGVEAPPPAPAAEATELAPAGGGGAPVASAQQPFVRGVNCARGHFNNPRALYCGICGLAMVQNSVVVVDGVRPPLGVLLLDDGTAYSLDGDYVLGREPEQAQDVARGRARPLKVDDGTGKISRVHARVSLHEWDVVITDLGSHNGTRVFNPGETSWRTLRADESVVLQPRGRLVIGQSTFEFQSIQRQ